MRMEARRADTAIYGQARFTTAGPTGHGLTFLTSPLPPASQFSLTRLLH
ncbi:hypothetical protein KPSA1_02177 [Pseudomonas syringae pv. actinidiae]|uniref:Uncharacterized protein n=1 Tax=Pseudomonas syringae pv. actinidiae TaxID=103796 RepID=A0A2V0Q7J8_PSESF|nr:hypothetical protein KPSA1_02177 [Pseudomonas syringae pv. actinidiae]